MVRNRAFGRILEERKKTTFFKTLVCADLLSESMRLIPYNFKSSECKNQPLTVTLKVVWGRTWTVKLSEFMGIYLMERKGWEKFLNNNMLGDEEFLTFTDVRDSCLAVHIYDKNGTEILKPSDPTTINASTFPKDVKKEEIGTTIGECSRSGAKRKERAEEEGNKASSSSSSSGAVPSFTTILTPSSLLLLTVPSRFAKKHMPKERTSFTIHDPKGVSHEVTYEYSKNSIRRFSEGWRIIVRVNSLVVEDKCTMKLIKPGEMILEVVHGSP